MPTHATRVQAFIFALLRFCDHGDGEWLANIAVALKCNQKYLAVTPAVKE
jgi:hypothetical protein